ncbi:MAG: IS30 family transposase [Mycoplasmataceae bacterium]|nr:IS30 family transposase [Mycoplasmataceae bacterium]
MNYLNHKERKIIEKLLIQGVGQNSISRIIERSKSTISYEITIFKKNYLYSKYEADKAQKLFEERQLNKWNKRKLETNSELKDLVLNLLRKDYSPEQVSWRLKLLKSTNKKWDNMWYICKETIYDFIYNSEEWKNNKYYKLLMRHRTRRKKYSSRLENNKYKVKSKILERFSIHERDRWKVGMSILDRSDLGHWETDSVEWNKRDKFILSVQIERMSRLVKITRIKNKKSKWTYWALKDLANEYHQHWILKTITFDNWTEWALHYKLKDEFKWIKTYFCDPYYSWQKWWVENMNMLIRRYFPKWISFSEISDDEVYKVQEKLNNRPRKCLWYLTPREFIMKELWREI